jgi:hypothetical protein
VNRQWVDTHVRRRFQDLDSVPSGKVHDKRARTECAYLGQTGNEIRQRVIWHRENDQIAVRGDVCRV